MIGNVKATRRTTEVPRSLVHNSQCAAVESLRDWFVGFDLLESFDSHLVALFENLKYLSPESAVLEIHKVVFGVDL